MNWPIYIIHFSFMFTNKYTLFTRNIRAPGSFGLMTDLCVCVCVLYIALLLTAIYKMLFYYVVHELNNPSHIYITNVPVNIYNK